MDTRTQIILVVKLATQGLSVSAIARQLDHHQETIGLWPKAELPVMIIDQKEDLNEPLWFVVKNPTGVDMNSR